MERYPRVATAFPARSRLAGAASLRGANSVISQDELGGSRLAESRSPLGGPNPMSVLACGDYRVSPLRAQRGQDEVGLGGRGGRGHRRRAGRFPSGLDVVLVVRAGHGTVPLAPVPAVLGVPPPLTRRLPTGPLPGTHPPIGEEQIVAKRAPFPSLPPGSGHRRTSAPRVAPLPCLIEGVEWNDWEREPEREGLRATSDGNQRQADHWPWIPVVRWKATTLRLMFPDGRLQPSN